MFGIEIDVTVDPDVAAFFEALGVLIGVTGIVAGVVHIVLPHPLLPYVSAFGIVLGFGIGLLFGDVDDNEDSPVDGPLEAIGSIAALVGIAMFPLGAFTPHPFEYASIGGLTLLILGAVLAYITGDHTDDRPREHDTYQVPDDPMALLEEDDD